MRSSSSLPLVECRNFNSTGCRFGDRCHFLHKSRSQIPAAHLPANIPKKQYTATQSTINVSENGINTSTIKPSSNDINTLWDFQHPIDNDEGVYYYGAPGTLQMR